MKAQSLSVNLVGPCNAQCPFCISRATWKTGIKDNTHILRNASQAMNFAKYHSVDTVLITGSGEPTVDATIDDAVRVMQYADLAGIPKIELQTNGVVLQQDPKLIDKLIDSGMNTVALSIASSDFSESARVMKIDGGFDYWALIGKLERAGCLIRVSLNMMRGPMEDVDLDLWARTLKTAGVHQLVLRELGLPVLDDENNQQHTKLAQEASAFVEAVKIGPDSEIFEEIRSKVEVPERHLRRLSFGADIYDYHGLSTCITTCMTDNTNPDEIRSFILQPDGHVYHSWNFSGSILL